MYSNVNIVLTILAYQFLTACRGTTEHPFPPFQMGVPKPLSEESDEKDGHSYKNPEDVVPITKRPRPAGDPEYTLGKLEPVLKNESFTSDLPFTTTESVPGYVREDCSLLVPYEDYNMPVPITIEEMPKVIQPDENRMLHIKRFQEFRLLCSETRFAYPIKINGPPDIVVKCLGKNLIEYDQKIFDWFKFKCQSTPRAISIATKRKCLGKYSIVKIGFRGRDVFVGRYKVCMDLWTKNTLYAWYVTPTPHHNIRQIGVHRPDFIRSPVFGDLDMTATYRRQTTTFEKILRSRIVARRYIRKQDGFHFLVPGHLIGRNEFNYIFEQDSTFAYENTAPQWQIFVEGIWRDVERLFRRNLATAKNSTHVILSGTYGTASLPDSYNMEQSLVLFIPNSITVPLFIWKMDYDIGTETGIVYIAMNNPYKNSTSSARICKTIKCPGKIIRKSQHKAVQYCCTKEAFEKTFGRFDDYLFKGIL